MVQARELAERIIREQELVIGPLAWREAKKVQGLSVDDKKRAIYIQGNAKKVLAGLVEQYEALFGPASLEVCKDAVKSLIPQAASADIPDALK